LPDTALNVTLKINNDSQNKIMFMDGVIYDYTKKTFFNDESLFFGCLVPFSSKQVKEALPVMDQKIEFIEKLFFASCFNKEDLPLLYD
jgi:hypothetical protein